MICVVVVVAFVQPGAALASSAVSTTFGTQPVGGAPASLSMGVAAGVDVVRYGTFQTMTPVSGGFNQDSIVKFFAQQGDAVLPVLGLPCDISGCAATWSPSPSEAARKMSSLISQFAARYGTNGSFWAKNPSVPYHPVQEFEIGNEQNLFKEWVVDDTHLHWAPQSHTQPDTQGPGDYAQVYEAARTALHQVDPTGIALVGGLADSAKLNVDVQSAERYVAALTPGTVDAVGYHDWVFDVSTASMTTDQFTALEEQDPAALRSWMEANGYSGVPISVTEIDACNQTPGTSVDSNCAVNHTSAQWGPVAANFVKWATCTPGMNINNIEGYWWGDTPSTGSNGWLALLDSSGTPTPYGQDFLAATKALTTNGCPNTAPAKPANRTAPSISGTFAVGQTITGSPGQWTGSPTLSYQWVRCDSNGANCDSIGDTGLSYALTAADVGSRVQLLVTAINSGGVASASSVLSAIVTATPPTSSPSPTPTPTTPAGSLPTTPPSPTPVTRGKTAAPKLLMKIRIVKIVRKGGRVTVTVRFARSSGTVSGTAVEVVKKHHKARYRLKSHRKNATTMTFTGRLRLGRWVLLITGKPASGYANPKAARRTVRVIR